MHHVTRCRLIPLVLIGWIALSAWGLSALLRGSVERKLTTRVTTALHADPTLVHIKPKFDGLKGSLEGTVGSEQLKEVAAQIAADALPAGEITENQVAVAGKSATVRAKVEGAVIVLEGEVADSTTVDELVAAIREISVVDDVQAQQLQVSGEVRSITWASNLVEFLPKFMSTCDEGVAEATDEIWALTGAAPGAVKHNELKEAWRNALPADAVADFDGLKLAEEPPAVPVSTGSPTVAVGTQNPPSVDNPDTQNPDPQNPEPGPNTVGSNTQNPNPEPNPNENPEPEPNAVTQNTPPDPEPDPTPEEVGPPEPEPLPPATPEQLDTIEEAIDEFTIYFARKSSYMTDRDRSDLDKIINALNEVEAAYELQVTGFADNIGDASFNRWLAGQRAERIQKYLLENNIVVKHTKAQIVKREPGYKPTPEEAREDRRAELRLIRQTDSP